MSGEELAAAFRRQVEDMDIEITEQMVNSIMPFGGSYALMAGSEFYEAKTVILTTGIVTKASLAGESDYVGKGVSYCATCDGGLYRGKTIAVICNNARFEHEVRYLAEMAAKVYYFAQYREPSEMPDNVELVKARAVSIIGSGSAAVAAEAAAENSNMVAESEGIATEAVTAAESGSKVSAASDRVAGIGLSDGTNLAVDGAFCLRDSIVMSALLPGLEMDGGHITVNRAMETSLPGIYAAGDCTGQPYQYTKAVGEGNVAAHSVLEYLAAQEKQSTGTA
ncbi:MAG: NAD(P)/FAD-dependent oxidoreductase [Clostridiales bacterium]|nr:NAD(P)/FAD-dependent oxidoreductase [Clostridiales bacterium]